ncbi:MAG: hypothetical protein MJZ24_06105 [Paludibacteraceae bacterium]|nr:hypothetical protein [Paludibacteraceae bacterium]
MSKIQVVFFATFGLLSCNSNRQVQDFHLHSFSGIVSGVHVSCFKTGGINMETVYLTNGDEVVVNGYLKDGCPLSDYLERNDSIVRTDECEDIYVYRDGMIDTFVIRY